MFYLIAFLCGILINVQLILNAQLGKKIGLINSTFISFAIGLMLLLGKLFFTDTVFEFDKIGTVPIIFFTGGFLAIFINVASNYLVPKLPLIYSTIFTFLGQMISGMIIDYFTGFTFSLTKISGYVLVVIGIFSIVYINYKEKIGNS